MSKYGNRRQGIYAAATGKFPKLRKIERIKGRRARNHVSFTVPSTGGRKPKAKK